MSYDVTYVRGHYWDTIFGLYQLIPFLLAVVVVLLEMARVEKIVWLQNRILLLAPLLLLLSDPWRVPWFRLPAYQSFTIDFSQQVASPVFLTLTGLALMYGWAWFKGMRYAEAGFCAMVLLAGYTDPRAFGVRA